MFTEGVYCVHKKIEMKSFIISVLYYAIVVASSVAFRYVFWLVPFLIGLVIAFILKPACASSPGCVPP